jgi:putative addiction module component (TIGR02574 family)
MRFADSLWPVFPEFAKTEAVAQEAVALLSCASMHLLADGVARMGSSTLEKIRSEALSLPEAERAELAHNLVASLDGQADPDAENAWDVEILRRLAEIDSGTANLIDRDEFRRRMRERMSRS